MKCSNELLRLAISVLLLSSACGGSDASSKSSAASAGSGGRRAESDRGGVDLVDDAGATHGGGRVEKILDAGSLKVEAPKGVGGMTAMEADSGAADRGPYYEADPWRGYFWTAKNGDGTTLERSKSFADSSFGSQVCVKGKVARTPDSSANAMLGVNVNQAKHSGAEPLTLVPRKDGVQVEVTNAGGSPLRVQLAAPDGVSNPQSRWCAALNGTGGFIPWSEFNTSCWDGSGNAYHHEPISGAMLLVPGDSVSARVFDFCLMRLSEGDAPPPGTGAGAAMSENAESDDAGVADMPAAGGGGAFAALP